MALYRYQCESCGETELVRYPMCDKPVYRICDECQGIMTQVLTSPQICATPFLYEEGNVRPRLKDHDGNMRQFRVGSPSHAEYLKGWDKRTAERRKDVEVRKQTVEGVVS